MNVQRVSRTLVSRLAGVAFAGLLAVACSTDSPSEPQQNPNPGPGTPPSGQFSISITADPGVLTLLPGSPTTSLITVQVRRSDGSVPPNNTTVQLSATDGTLGGPSGVGASSVAIGLLNGTASITYHRSAAAEAGTVQLQGVLQGSVGTARIEIRAAETFVVTSVSPSSGVPAGGDNVQVFGTGFIQPVIVRFGGVPAVVQSVTPTSIRVRTPTPLTPVPVGQTRTVGVEVVNAAGTATQSTSSLDNAFTYVAGGGVNPQPVIFSVTPASGVNEGGTRVTINGDGFQSPVQVFFGQGTSAANFNGIEATVESVSSTQIVVRTPAATGFGQANQNALVNILIINTGNGFSTVRTAAYRYGTSVIITAFTPQQIVFDSQATITISGQGFESPVQVFIAGIEATPTNVTGSQVIVRAPVPVITNCNSVSGAIQVINRNSGASDTTNGGDGPAIPAFVFLVPEPVVTGVSPSSGTGNGGTNVTISGVGFDAPVQVTFGDAAASVINVNPGGTAITALTPSFNQFEEEACDDNGDGTEGSRFVRTSVDVTVTNLLTDCDNTLTGGYTYVPSDTSCRGDQGEPPATQCTDGFDNDGDTLIDAADPQCTGPTDNSEST